MFQIYVEEALEALKKGHWRDVLKVKIQLNEQIFFQSEKIFLLDYDIVV